MLKEITPKKFGEVGKRVDTRANRDDFSFVPGGFSEDPPIELNSLSKNANPKAEKPRTLLQR